MVSELTGAILLLFLVRILYQLLNGIDRAQASLMVTFVVISVPITFLNVFNDVAALALLHSGTFLSVSTERSEMLWPSCSSACTPPKRISQIFSRVYGCSHSARSLAVTTRKRSALLDVPCICLSL